MIRKTASLGLLALCLGALLPAASAQAAANLEWTGAVDANWDTATANWRPVGGGAATTYTNGDAVTFNDSGSNTTIAIQGGGVSPGSMTFSNSGVTYTFSGGAIGGTGSLSKNGSGTVTIKMAAGYSGATSVSAGTLKLIDDGTILSSSGFALSGGSLKLDNSGTANMANRLSNSAAVTMTGGTLELIGAAGATTETVGQIILSSGLSTLTNTPGAGGSKLTGDRLTHVAGARLNCTGTMGTASSQILFTLAPTLEGGVLPYATVAGTDLATYNAFGIAAYSGYYTGIIDNATASDNVKVTADDVVTIPNKVINSLTIVGDNVDVTGGGGIKLTLTSGALVTSGSSITVATGRLNLGSSGMVTVLSGTASISSIVEGTALTKLGSGTLTLSAANEHTGTTLIGEGALRVTGATALGTAAGGTEVCSGAALELNGGVAVGAGEALTLSGTGVSSGGALRSVAGVNSWAGTVALSAASTVAVDANTLTVSGAISGSAALTKSGSGTLILSGANTYGGSTTVSAGTLQCGASSVIPDGSVVTLAAGTTLDLNGNSDTVGGLNLTDADVTTGAGTLTLAGGVTTQASGNSSTIAGKLSLGSAGQTFTVADGGAADDLAVSATVSGAAGIGFIKAGAGLMAVSGGSDNTYTGTTTVSAGTLSLRKDAALGSNAAGTTVASGATLEIVGDLAYATAEPVTLGGGTFSSPSGANSFAGAFTLNASSNVSAAAGTLTLTGAMSCGAYTPTFKGAAGTIAMQGAIGGSGGITKSEGGTLILSSAGSNYTGATTLSASGGTLRLGAAGVIPDGSVVTWADTAGTVTFDLNDKNETVGGLSSGSSANNIVLFGNGGASTLTVNDASNRTFGGIFSATADAGDKVSKAGAGTLTLSNGDSSGYPGLFEVQAGATLSVSADGALGTAGAATTVLSGGTLNFSVAYATAEPVTISGTGVGAAGALTAPGVNLDVPITLGANATVAATASTLELRGGVTTAGHTLTVAGSYNTTLSTVKVTGAGGLAKTGSGTLTLSFGNDYTGATTISAGTVVASVDGALGTAAGDTTVADGATLNFGVAYPTAETVHISGTGVGAAGAVTAAGVNLDVPIVLDANATVAATASTLALRGGVTTGGNTLTVAGSYNTTISTVKVTGAGGLAKTGSGTLTLSVTSDYTGATTISAGTVKAGANAALGTADGDTTVVSGATLEFTSAYATAETVTINGTGVGGAGAIKGSVNGDVDVEVALGSNASIISATSTLTLRGGIDTAGSTVTIGGSSDTTVSTAAITGAGGLTKTGSGTLTLSFGNGYTGATTISAGTVVAGINDALGTTDGATTVASGAALAFSAAYGTAEPVTISGTGVGSGGALRGTAGVTVAAVVTVGAAASIVSTNDSFILGGAVDVNGQALTLGSANSMKLSGVVSGAGSIAVTPGAGKTVTVTADNTFTGSVTVSTGTLSIIDNGTLNDASGFTVGANGTLVVDNTGTANNSDRLKDAATLALGGGTFQYKGRDGTSSSETLGAVTCTSGTSTFQNTKAGAGTAVVTCASLASSGGSVYFTGDIGSSTASRIMFTAAPTLVPEGTGVITYATAYDGTNTGAASYHEAKGIFVAGIGGIIDTAAVGAAVSITGDDTMTRSRTTGGNGAIGSLNMLNNGTDVLADAAYTLELSGGALSAYGGGGAALSTSANVTITAGAVQLVIFVESSTTLTINGPIAGSGGIRKTGGGTLILAGACTYTGATTVFEGTLRLSAADRLPNGSAVTVSSGATLDMNGNSDTVGSLAGAGTLSMGAGTLTCGGDNTSTEFSGSITGAGGLTKAGTGTLTLSYASGNGYTGTTLINAGAIKVTQNSALGTNAAGTTVANTAALIFDGGVTYSTTEAVGITGTGGGTGAIRNLSGSNSFSGAVTMAAASTIAADAGTLELKGGIGTAGFELTVGGAGNTTVSTAAITGGGNLVKSGAGTLTLSMANTIGTVTINENGGTISANADSALGTAAGGGTTVNTGGTLNFGTTTYTQTEALVINGTGTGGIGALRNTASLSFGGAITLGSAASIVSAADTFTLTGGITTDAGKSVTFGGANNITLTTTKITGAGGLTKEGNGTLTLSFANDYTGTTNVNGGILKVNAAGVLGGTGTGTVVNGGTLEFALTYATEPVNISGTGYNSAGAIKTSFSGNLDVPITLGASASIVPTTSTLTLRGGVTTDTGRILTIGSAYDTTISTAAITGGGGLTKEGNGTLTLSFANTYTGSTTVSGGTLKASVDAALGTADAVGTTVASGATLEFTVAYPTAEKVTINGTGYGSNNGAIRGSIAGNVDVEITLGSNASIWSNAHSFTLRGGVDTTANGYTLTFGSNYTMYFTTKKITGSGGLIKTGTERANLSFANDYTGATTVSQGTLTVDADGALGGTGTGTTVNSGTTLGFSAAYSSVEPVTINGTGANSNGAISYGTNGTIEVAITLGSDASVYSSSGGATQHGTVNTATHTLTIASSSITLYFTGAITGDGNIVCYGSNKYLSASNTIGTVTVKSGGELVVTVDGALGGTGSGTTVESGGSLAFSGAFTYATVEPVTVSGTGTTSTGAYRGSGGAASAAAVTLAADALFAGGNGGFDQTGTVATAGYTLTLGTGSYGLTVSGVISGAGNVKNGNTGGTVSLKGDNSLSGTVTVSGGGTVSLVDGGRLASASGYVVSRGRFAVDNTGSSNNNDRLKDTGTLTLAGGIFQFKSQDNAAGSTETVGAVTCTAGLSTFQNTDGGAGSAVITCASLASTGGTVYFYDDFGDAAPGNQIIFSSAPALSPAVGGIITFATAYNGTTRGAASYDAATPKGIIVQGTVGTIDGAAEAPAAKADVIVNADDMMHYSRTGSGVHQALNSLILVNDNTDVTTDGGNYTLELASGLLSSYHTCTISANVTIDFGAATGVIYVAEEETLTISGPITGSGGIRKTGPGLLVLGAACTYTGTTTVAYGAGASVIPCGLKLNAADILPNLSAVTVESGARLDLNGNNDQIGSLAGAGSLLLGAGTLKCGGDNTSTEFSGVITGTGGALTKEGSGTLTLSYASENTYTGATTINAGAIKVKYNKTLGTADAGTTVADGAALIIDGGVSYSQDEAVEISGTGGGSGAIRSLSGSNRFDGAITLGAAATIAADAGSLELQGVIDTNGNALTLGGAGDLTFSTSAITESGNLVKSGAGTATISIASTVGTVTVDGGKLVLSAANTMGAVTINNGGRVNANANGALGDTGSITTVNTGGTLSIGSSNYSTAEQVTLNGTGTGGIGALTNTYGGIFAGPITLGSAASIVSTVSTFTLTGGVTTAGFTLTVGGASDSEISALITGTGGLTKTGAGTLELSAANDYSGATAIDGGTLVASDDSSLGTVDGTGTSVANLAALRIWNSAIAEKLTLNGAGVDGGGALRSYGGSGGSVSGPITLGSATTITAPSASALTLTGGINTAGFELTLDGTAQFAVSTTAITGGGNLVIAHDSGTSRVTLSTANTIGTVTVQSGALLRVSADGALGNPAGSATTVQDGGMLQVNVNYATAEPLTISGTGIGGAGALTNNSNYYFDGPITLGANATIVSAVDTFKLRGGIDTTVNGYTVTLGGLYKMEVSTAKITGAGGVTSTGSDVTLKFANDYTGQTNVTGGTLKVNADNALGATGGGGNTVANGGTLCFISAYTAAEPVTIYGTGTSSNGALKFDLTSITFDGPVTLGAAATITGAWDGCKLRGGVSTGGNELTLYGSGGSLTVENNAITGDGNLIKTGSASVTISVASTVGTVAVNGGTLTLSAANTCGAVTVASGATLSVGVDGALGNTGSGTTVQSGGMLTFTVAYPTAEPVNISGTGVSGAGALRCTAGVTVATPVTLGGAASIVNTDDSFILSGTVDVNGQALTLGSANSLKLSNVVSGGGSIASTPGSGKTVTLTADNTFTGSVTVSTGTLKLVDNGTLNDASGFTVSSGTTLLVDNTGSANNNNRLKDTATLALANATFQFKSQNHVDGSSETFGAVTCVSGTSTFTNTQAAAGYAVVTGGSLASSGGTVNFTGNLGVTAGSRIMFTTPPDLSPPGTGIITFATARDALDNYGAASYWDTKGIAVVGVGGIIDTAMPGAAVQITADDTMTRSRTTGGYGAIGSLAMLNDGTDVLTDGGPFTLELSSGSLSAYGGGAAALSTAADLTIDGDTAEVVVYVAADTTLTINGPITGSGGFRKTGSGTLVLKVPCTYTGATTVAGGTLRLDAADIIPDASALTVSSGATLDMNGNSDTVGSLAGAGTLSMGAGTLTCGGDNSSTEFSGSITGAGGLTKNGTGTLTLSYASGNGYTGATAINAGAIKVTQNSALGTAAAGTTVANTAALIFDGGVTYSTAEAVEITGTGGGSGAIRNLSGSNSFSGAVTLAAASTVAADAGTLELKGGIDTTVANHYELTMGGAGNLTVSTTGIANDGNLVKNGAGTLTLSVANALGTVLIDTDGGTIVAAADSALGTAVSGTTVNSGGTLSFGTTTYTPAEPVEINGTGTGGIGALTNSASLSFSGPITLGAASSIVSAADTLTLTGGVTTAGFTLTVGGDTDTAFTTAAISGGGGLTKEGDGTLTLSFGNDYTGATAIDAGTVVAGANNALGTAAGDTTVASGATLEFTAVYGTAEAVTISGTGVGGAGAIKGSVNGAVAAPITLGASASIISTANTLELTGGITAGAGKTVTFGGDNNITVSTVKITGDGAVTKEGNGTLTLSFGNDYTGATTISAGTVVAGANDALGTAAGDTTVASGATLEFTAAYGTAEPVNISGTGYGDAGAIKGSVNGTVAVPITLVASASIVSTVDTLTLTGGITTDAGKDVTFGGANNITVSTVKITGDGAVTKTGNGTLTLSFGNDYTGATTISGGTVVAGVNNALGTAAGDTTVASGATLEFTAAYGTAEPVNISGTGYGSAGAIKGSVNGVVAAPITLGASASIISTVDTLELSGGITAGAGKTVTIGGDNDTTVSTVKITGDGGLAKTGDGTLTLSFANDYAGATTIGDGTVVAGVDGALGTAAGGATVASGATLEFTVAYATAEPVTISGTGFGSAGAIKGSVNGAVATPITLGAAASIISTVDTLELSGGITTAGSTVTIDGDGDTTVSTVKITGAGGLTKEGSGTLTLSFNNDYTDDTLIREGTVYVNCSQASSAATCDPSGEDGATLAGNGTVDDITVTAGGTLSPGTVGDSTCTLTCVDLAMSAGTSFLVDLAGTGAGQADKVIASNDVALGGATLTVTVDGGYTPAVDDFVDIIEYGDDISGTFDGLPEAATFASGGVYWRVNYGGGTVRLTCCKQPTTTTLVSSANPSAHGDSVTITATVTGSSEGAPTPTGSVTFTVDGNQVGVVGLNGSGQAQIVLTSLSLGTHPVVGSYGGSTMYDSSVSATLYQLVGPTQTALESDEPDNTIAVGETIVFTATVTALPSGSGTPTGWVTFRDGTTVLDTKALDGSGVATLTTSALSPGYRSITATYTGVADYDVSVSPVLYITVTTGALHHFNITTHTPQTTNVGWVETVTARTEDEDLVATNSSTLDLTFSGLAAGQVKFYTSAAYVTETTTVTLYQGVGYIYVKASAETTEPGMKITADDDEDGCPAAVTDFITVTNGPGAIDHYVLAGSTTQDVGDGFTVSVTAKDASNQTVTWDSSTEIVLSNTGSAKFYTDNSYTVETNAVTLSSGLATLYVKDYTAETITLTVTDSMSKTGSLADVVVRPGVLDHYVVTAHTPQVAGVGWTETVTAVDAYNNPLTSATNNVVMTSDGDAEFCTDGDYDTLQPSATYTLVAGTVTIYVKDRTPETIDLTATGAGKSGTTATSIVVTGTPGAIDHYEISTHTPQTIDVGWTEKVWAKDVNGITVISAANQVNLSSTNNGKFCPDDDYQDAQANRTYTLSGGRVTIYVIDSTAEKIKLTASYDGKMGDSGEIRVFPAIAIGWVVGFPGEITGDDEGDDINWDLGTEKACCSTYNTLAPGNGGTGDTYNMRLRNYGITTVKVTAVVTVEGLPNPWGHSGTATPDIDTFALCYTLDENNTSWAPIAQGGAGTKIIDNWASCPDGEDDQNFDLQLKTPTSVGPSHAGAQTITVTLTASTPP